MATATAPVLVAAFVSLVRGISKARVPKVAVVLALARGISTVRVPEVAVLAAVVLVALGRGVVAVFGAVLVALIRGVAAPEVAARVFPGLPRSLLLRSRMQYWTAKEINNPTGTIKK